MPGRLSKELLTKVAIGIAVVLAVIVAIYALSLLTIGQPWTLVPEVPENSQQTPQLVSVETIPVPAAVVPLTAAVLLITGLLIRRLWVAWIGLAILIGFSALFVFGVGGGLLPVAGLLFLLLATISVAQRGQPEDG